MNLYVVMKMTCLPIRLLHCTLVSYGPSADLKLEQLKKGTERSQKLIGLCMGRILETGSPTN